MEQYNLSPSLTLLCFTGYKGPGSRFPPQAKTLITSSPFANAPTMLQAPAYSILFSFKDTLMGTLPTELSANVLSFEI